MIWQEKVTFAPDPEPRAPPSDFIAWVYRELDRQGIDVLHIPDAFKVLDEIVSWRDSFPNEAYANLVNWNRFDVEFDIKEEDEQFSSRIG
jgi:hypothetical protein